MKTKERTQGKLRVREFTIESEKDGIWIATTDSDLSHDESLDLANAEHLARCWNSHDELLGACQAALDYMLDDKASDQSGALALQLLKQAIKEAV